MPGTLILLRHGESEWNAKNLFTGWVDVDLNDKGETEARRGVELLVESGLLPDVVHTSVLVRATRTAWIALDTMGYVSEGSGQNLFIVRKNVIYTPPIHSSILGGITRDSILTIARGLGYDVREEVLPREVLYLADEAFFCGTAVEVTPIRSIDRIAVGSGRRPVTDAIRRTFFDIVNGELPDTHGWLTFVYADEAHLRESAAPAAARAR